MIIRIHHPAPAYDSYRAACVQSLFNAGGIGFVQKLLTHKDPSLTQRYAHLEDSALKNSASLVGDFLADSIQPDGDADNSR